MKYLFTIIFSLSLNLIFAQEYYMLYDNKLNVTKKTELSNLIRSNGITVIENLSKLDQSARIDSSRLKMIDSTDAYTYKIYRNWVQKNGCLSFSRLKNQDEITKSRSLKNYTLQVHYADRYGLDFLSVLEQCLELKLCNENDLMDFFVTYLWRNTQFKIDRFANFIPYHKILLPDLEKNKYRHLYKYAISKYFEDCRKVDKTVGFFFLNNISQKDKSFAFNKYTVPHYFKSIPNLFIKAIINYLTPSLEQYFLMKNPLGFKDASYSILICTHPNLNFSPTRM